MVAFILLFLFILLPVSNSKDSVYPSSPKWIASINKLDIPKQSLSKRQGHSATLVGTEVFLFGGCYLDDKCYSDLTVFNILTNSWHVESPDQLINISPRSLHSASLLDTLIFVFGGVSSNEEYSNELFTFDTKQRVWQKLQHTDNYPSSRAGHSAVVYHHSIFFFGGFSLEEGYLSDLHVLNTEIMEWYVPDTTGNSPSQRSQHSAVVFRKNMYVFGGGSDIGSNSDLFSLNLESLTWTRVVSLHPLKHPSASALFRPKARQGHTTTIVSSFPDRFFLIGGCNYRKETCFHDIFSFKFYSLVWDSVTLPADDMSISLFSPREGHAVVSLPSGNRDDVGSVLIFGGCDVANNCYDDVLKVSMSLESDKRSTHSYREGDQHFQEITSAYGSDILTQEVNRKTRGLYNSTIISSFCLVLVALVALGVLANIVYTNQLQAQSFQFRQDDMGIIDSSNMRQQITNNSLKVKQMTDR